MPGHVALQPFEKLAKGLPKRVNWSQKAELGHQIFSILDSKVQCTMKTDWTPHAREYQRTASTFPDHEKDHLCGPIEKPSSTIPTIIMKHSSSLTETSCMACLHPRLAYAGTTVNKMLAYFESY